MYDGGMIRKMASKHRLDSSLEIKQNLRYWLSRPPEERLAAVDSLRAQVYGDEIRLKRIVRVVRLDKDAIGQE